MSALSNFPEKEFFFPPAVVPHHGFTSNNIFMMALMRERSKESDCVNFLEVGSWCGNSAIIWAQAIKEFFGSKGMLTCVDSWAPYLNSDDKAKQEDCQLMDIAAITGAAQEVFAHNMRVAQKLFGVKVNSICGATDEILPILKEEIFDIVYLDAAHSYEPVKRDLATCARLVKESGYICGDDLELQLHELNEETILRARKNVNTDSCIFDPLNNRHFHPGVTLAVGEYFGVVSTGGKSFWAMKKKKGSFERVNVTAKSVFKPMHLNREDREQRFDQVLTDFSDNKIKWNF